MEISRTTYRAKLVRLGLTMLLSAFVHMACAQPPVKKYTIKNGRMYIELGKKINNASLDSFTAQYNLNDLPLKELIKTRSTDSLKKTGMENRSLD